jgi:glycosyltransferase involved in cell wall biosynthesis
MTAAPQGPSFSVVINNYNYGQYLSDALDSALTQIAESDEILVVDDGSTDNSLDILSRYESEYGIRVISQANQGQMKAVREGIRAAKREVILLLDSDDYFLAGYLDRLRKIYQDNSDIDFAFTGAIVGGSDAAQLKEIRDNLDRMELCPGKIGPTKWSTLLFYEFVGVPTSGISLHAALARKILSLPMSIDATQKISVFRAKLLGLSESEARMSGFNADGIIVRSASILNAGKYYDDKPGFFYRIHGKNKHATMTRPARLYIRAQKRKLFVDTISELFSLPTRPTARELEAEIVSRAYGVRWRRLLHIRTRYALAALITCRGPLSHRLSALTAAFGLKAIRPGPPP